MSFIIYQNHFQFFLFMIFSLIILKYTCESINRTLQSQRVSILYRIQEVPISKLSRSIGILIGLFVVSLSPSSEIEEQNDTPFYKCLLHIISNQSSPPGHSTLYILVIEGFDVIQTNKQTYTRSHSKSL
jgi:hypothetical protein